MEARPQKQITERDIHVRQVTHYQVTWTESEPAAEGAFSVQLILDEGAEEYVIRPTADDLDVLKSLLRHASNVYFDQDRKVLMFGTAPIS